MARKIDSMRPDEITCQLVRIAAWADETKKINRPAAILGLRMWSGAVALGRREVCTSLLDDLRITFGIEVDDGAQTAAS